MKVLYIDTTTADLVVAVVEENTVRDFTCRNLGTRHSETLCACVQHALDSCCLKFFDLDAYACAVGPGSFTGIRIGVSTVKGYKTALDRPLIQVNCLQAVAHSARAKHRSALINAGNGYYFADYSENAVEPCLIAYDDARAENALLCEFASEYLDGAVKIVRDSFFSQNFVDELVPLYIRRSQAEEKK